MYLDPCMERRNPDLPRSIDPIIDDPVIRQGWRHLENASLFHQRCTIRNREQAWTAQDLQDRVHFIQA